MAGEIEVTLENVFEPETIWAMMNNDQRLRSLQFLDTKRRIRNKYRQILKTFAKNSNINYGPRMSSIEIIDSGIVTPSKDNVEYKTKNIDFYCMALQSEGVLKRDGIASDGSAMWVYVIPHEMLPRECQEVYSILEKEGLNLEEITDKTDMGEDQLIRSLDILSFQCHAWVNF